MLGQPRCQDVQVGNLAEISRLRGGLNWKRLAREIRPMECVYFFHTPDSRLFSEDVCFGE